jgi:hypothetical protein
MVNVNASSMMVWIKVQRVMIIRRSGAHS